jgi:hypothetical protein
MIYLKTPYTQIHSLRLKKYMSPSLINIGSESISEAVYVEANWWHDKRRNNDRRERSLKPLLDLRITRDRRDDPDVPSIDIEV